MSNTLRTAVAVGEEMFKFQDEPLSNKEAEIMLAMLLEEKTDLNEGAAPFDLVKARNHLGFAIIEKRLEAAGVKASPDTILFTSIKSHTPGVAVMYAAAVKAVAEKINDKEVRISHFIEHGFPFGFPSEESLHRIWDRQKRHDRPNMMGSDNWLDYPEAWRSNNGSED